jgi:hypothetical protein
LFFIGREIIIIRSKWALLLFFDLQLPVMK